MDVLVKSHAAAARVAAGIDAMLELREQYKFAIGDIASMALGIPKIIQGRLTNPHPVDLQAAQMCLPFSVALASKIKLAPGQIATLGISDFEAGLKDQSLHALEERTTIALDDEVEAASNELSTAARVSVTLRDGRTFSRLVPAPKGSPSRSFTGEEHEARFMQELSSRVSEKSAARSLRCHAISTGSIHAALNKRQLRSTTRSRPRATSFPRGARQRDAARWPHPLQVRAGAEGKPVPSLFTGEEHEARFTQELSSRSVSDKVCGEIVAMSRNLDRLNPSWLGRVLSGLSSTLLLKTENSAPFDDPILDQNRRALSSLGQFEQLITQEFSRLGVDRLHRGGEGVVLRGPERRRSRSPRP